MTTCLPILQLSCRHFFGKASHHASLSAPLQPRFGSLWLLAFPKAKIAVESEGICECDGHKVHKLSQRRLTAKWLAPQESDCSQMNSKVSSDWLPSYITASRPVLKIFKMAGCFLDSPHNWFSSLQPACITGPHHQTTHCDHKQGKCKLFWNFATHLQDSTAVFLNLYETAAR
jgi:hypothetical protein